MARGFWRERVLPRLNHRALAGADASAWRAPVCAGAVGTVLDIGFGSGPDLPFYGDAVTRVLAAEPSDVAWRLAAERVVTFGRPVERVSLDAADLAGMPDEAVDTAVSAWSMCTVPDLVGALVEVRRVLRPGGELRFVEHARSPDPRVARAQDRVQPVWGRVAGGCHVDRDLVGMLDAAGYDVTVARAVSVAGGPARPWSWFVTGSARPR
ncbi:class I SAM-dependent methyltransferase [Phycicoccus sp. BSK3Z-2]|uniref:Class I SAM-dependent methyltransferase n=1 Tax=Phycicoccus avicenniae TaxID=2828860 RepID=A0A941I160_9MICO|nr:class I SAM-dependent methyltransferase [Phycicoccus avicenniae]MBR7743961.1 class I SAM-dependent methyltransferase [Phycicoccus avicenniae]